MTQLASQPTEQRNGPGLWDRLCRVSLTRSRLSRRSLERFCREMATTERTLVVHSVDVDHRKYFPNALTICSRASKPADIHTDASYRGLEAIEEGSFGVALCTGLLEHIAEPERFVAELRRILRPGGRLIVTASAVFPFHGAPNNYFHFTPNGMRRLFRDWTRIEVLRGSSGPFETIGILLQRINMQCDVFPPVRLVNEAVFRVLPLLDVFVYRQYDNLSNRERGGEAECIMPAALHAVVIR